MVSFSSITATSELNRSQRGTSGGRVVERPDHPSGCPVETDGPPSAVEYLLVHNSSEAPIAGNGLGWTLIARHDGWCWSAALAPRGAGGYAAARIAKAVAVRVLAEQGVAVTGWSIGTPDTETPQLSPTPTAFRARLCTPHAVALAHGVRAAVRPHERRRGR